MIHSPAIPLRLAGVVSESVVDGPGLRFVVFAQGCPHRCPGCHNPHTWGAEGGTLTDSAAVFARIRGNPGVDGVTLSGGEPFAQAAAMADIAARCRAAGLQVLCYTGYTWERLVAGFAAEPGWRALAEAVHLLVDGPFEIGRRFPATRFRGSANQRVIDVAASLAQGRTVTTDFPDPAAWACGHTAPTDPFSLRG